MDFCTTFRCLQWKHKFSQQSWDCSLSVFQGQVLPLVVDIKGQINISSAHTCPHCLLQSPPCSVLKATLVTLPCFTWVRQSGQTQVICLDASEMIKKQSSIRRSGSQVINTQPCGKWGSGFLKRMKGEEGNSVTHEILWGKSPLFIFEIIFPSNHSLFPLHNILLQTASDPYRQGKVNPSLMCWKWFCLGTERKWVNTCDCQATEGVEGSMLTGFQDVLEKLLIAKATHCILSHLEISQSPQVCFRKTLSNL